MSVSQFPPWNTYHMHTGPFFFMTIVCVTYPKKKFLRASLSCRLVSSRLKIPTTCTRDFFFFISDYCLRDIQKLSYSLTLMVVSRFPPKNTYHMHRGLFFMWLLFAWHTPNKFLRASLSCWLVSSCLKILTTCKQEFFSCDYCLRDIHKYLTASLSWWLVRRAILLLVVF